MENSDQKTTKSIYNRLAFDTNLHADVREYLGVYQSEELGKLRRYIKSNGMDGIKRYDSNHTVRFDVR
jgi:hypothetical protein